MGSQFVEAVNQMSGCMGYTVLFCARSKCVCCICIYMYIYIYIYIPSMYKSLKVKLSMCTNTPHWGLTKSPDTKFLSRLLTKAANHGGAVRSKQDNGSTHS